MWTGAGFAIYNEVFWVIVETERLYLREMDEGDLDALKAIMQDEKTMYAYNGIYSDEDVAAWLGRQKMRYAKYGFGLWAVILKETGEMIGQCGITMQEWNGREVMEVGYLFNRNFWHHGYAAEAARACRDYAFEKLGADEVYSIIRDTNIPSQNVAKRNGMQVVDTWTKHFRGEDMPHLLFCVKKPR